MIVAEEDFEDVCGHRGFGYSEDPSEVAAVQPYGWDVEVRDAPLITWSERSAA